MDRRAFIGAVGGAALLAGCARSGRPRPVSAAVGPPPAIGGRPPADLREELRRDLFDHFIPFLDQYVVDPIHGGFICAVDPAGRQVSTGKHIWHEGRGTWLYSYLCNHFEARPEWLQTARRSIEFVLAHRPVLPEALWPEYFTREGRIQEPPPGRPRRVVGDLYFAEGLAEFSEAGGDERHLDLARSIVLKCVRIYDRLDYYPEAGNNYLTQAPRLPGARVLGHWLVLLRLSTQMLRRRPDDADLRALSDRCLEAILLAHHNPEYDLLNELIEHDMTRAEAFKHFCYLGHAIEALWMAMDEAVRRGDRTLLQRLAPRFKRHVDVAWDPVFGGVLRSLEDIDAHWFSLDKTCWVQLEALVGSMLLYEQTGDPWAVALWDRLYPWLREHFAVRGPRFQTWQSRIDRRGQHNGTYRSVEFYHTSRHMMLNIQSLDRMLGSARS